MDKEELINGYFEGSLSESQLGEVQNLLKTDANFAADFEFQKELKTSLKKEERRELKAMFKTLEKKETKPETKVIRMRPWLVAASVAMLVGIGSWLFFFNSPEVNTDQLYAANFTPYDNVVHPIERGNQMEDLKTKAFTAYEEKEYSTARDLFKELQTKQTDDYIKFYEAIVLMQLNKHQAAIPLLQNYRNGNGELIDRATWYLALAHLKTNELTKCRAELKLLIQKNSFKADAAKVLMEQLE